MEERPFPLWIANLVFALWSFPFKAWDSTFRKQRVGEKSHMGCSKTLCGPVREATGVYKQEAKEWGRQDKGGGVDGQGRRGKPGNQSETDREINQRQG